MQLFHITGGNYQKMKQSYWWKNIFVGGIVGLGIETITFLLGQGCFTSAGGGFGGLACFIFYVPGVLILAMFDNPSPFVANYLLFLSSVINVVFISLLYLSLHKIIQKFRGPKA